MQLSKQSDHFFAADGPLANSIDHYEPRTEQQDLAHQISLAMTRKHNLLAEAGTGTGKTLAYLVPALQSGLKVVVSTGTKALQEQIVLHDVPTIAKALGRTIDVAVMKGRNNYLCEVAFDHFTKQYHLPNTPQEQLRGQVITWRNKTQTGDRAELTQLPDDSPVWRDLSVSSEQCLGRTCTHYDNCFVTRMRRRAQTAELIVVNHHLYFADATLRKRLPGEADIALIPPHDLVIFDEAHELEDVAAQHFGYHVSDVRFSDLARDIGRALHDKKVLALRFMRLLPELEQHVRQLYDQLPFTHVRQRLHSNHVHADPVKRAYAQLDHTMERVEAELTQAHADWEESKVLSRRAAQLTYDLAQALNLPARASLAQSNQDAAHDTQPYVRYTETTGRARHVVARPLAIADQLQQMLGGRHVIALSATMTVNGTFDHFAERTGFADATTHVVASPFNYRAQAQLYIADDLPEPAQPQFHEQATERCAALVQASGGGAFVLCTSHRVLPSIRERLLRIPNIRVLMQGEAPRFQLVEEFRQHDNAVLIATMSFWRGIDVPGRALRLVIIDRLPFTSPGDPMMEARSEYLQSMGRSSFWEYDVPHAALLLRQGFGRLIRRQTDHGMIALLDRRVLSKAYGKIFLNSLPDCPRVTALKTAAQWLRQNKA